MEGLVAIKVATTRTTADVRSVGSILRVHLSYPDIPQQDIDPLVTHFLLPFVNETSNEGKYFDFNLASNFDS